MGNTRYKILLIEDDKLDQMAFKRLVEKEKLPYDYMTAGSVSEAKSILDSKQFDIVVSDHSLGDGTAFDVLDSVKNTPFILVTGAGNEEVAVKAWRAGAYDYLIKDLDRNYLKAIPITIENAVKQKKAEEEIHRLSQAIEQSPSTVVITDIKGDIEYVNPKFTQNTGYTLEEVKGKNLRILESSEQLPKLHKELWGKITSGKEWHGEFHNQKKNNGTFWESASISAITNSEGAITGFLKVAADITERKEAEEKLREAEENYRTQFEGAMDAIFVADAETGILIDCNPSATRLVGREKSELIGQHQQILHPAEVINGGGFSKTFKEHLKEKQGQTLETQIVTKTGEIRDVAIKASLIEVRGRKLLQGIFRDITEHKETERKLNEAIELKSQFISTVSHELRTPLTSMKEGIAIILDGVAGAINDDQKNFLNLAQRNVDRLALLINDVLDFQKLEAGKMKMNIQENNINEVVEEVQKTMLPSAKKKGLDILLELDGNQPKARFDRDKITQVLTNLVNNAIKFTEQGQMTVGVQQRDEELVIRVSDTGMGIPKNELSKVFERFYRVQRPGKQIQGTGLGLPIVEKIMTMHGGRIEVESEVDKGTTFTIFLPLAAKPIPEFPSAEMDKLLENNLVNNQAHTK
jgi:PAS domain S-box-containing protein